jgi:hypothetical protein
MLQLLDLERGRKLVLAQGAAYYIASGFADFSTGVRNDPCPIGTLVLSPRQGQFAARRDSVIAVFEHAQLQGTDVPVLIRYGKPVHTISKMVYETPRRSRLQRASARFTSAMATTSAHRWTC